MDGYIVSILSGWELDKDSDKAIENLRASAEKFPEFRFIEAACLMKIADLVDNDDEAKALYRKVLGLKGEGLDGYRALARDVLKSLGDTGTVEDSIRKVRPSRRK